MALYAEMPKKCETNTRKLVDHINCFFFFKNMLQYSTLHLKDPDHKAHHAPIIINILSF